MRNAHRILGYAAAEDLICDLLLGGKPVVEPVNQDIGVNESGHGRTGPPWSSRACAAGGARSPDRIDGAATLGRPTRHGSPRESLESHRPPAPSRYRRPDEYRIAGQSLWGASPDISTLPWTCGLSILTVTRRKSLPQIGSPLRTAGATAHPKRRRPSGPREPA